MGSSSFLNAFRLIFKRPVLILLLLPLQLALPLVGRLMPEASGFGIYAVELLLYLAAGFLLIPPAMELMHDGTQGLDSPPGWYGRGLSRHGWKPVAIAAIEVGVVAAVGILFIVILAVVMTGALAGLINADVLADPTLLKDTDIYSALMPVIVPILIMTVIFLILYEWIVSFFAMMLPAAADRSFGDAFKALFKKPGFRKTLKVFGVYLLTDFISSLVVIAVTVVGTLVTEGPFSPEDVQQSMLDFTSTWAYYGIGAVLSLTMLFKYGYIFSVFQEIKNGGPAAAPVAPVALEAGESGGIS
jgi:hypothetical protein